MLQNVAKKSFIFKKICNSSMPGPLLRKSGPPFLLVLGVLHPPHPPRWHGPECSDNRDNALINAWTINSCNNAWIIISFYFEYRSPIRLRNKFINPIRNVYFWFEIRTNPIGSDLHTSRCPCRGSTNLIFQV